ncbi:MAG TPA: serine/threonine-protein kinase, partial [Allocoleopsis sp.]
DYRLVAIVGMGGAGTVYLGERADRAYSAQVAIKVVANTQLSHEIQRRFFAERQILANLNHPYIGRLLDAGETFFDEPFLVMEYVHGEPIDRFCDNQRLTVEERISLFLKICEAVQYAHRNLIVHRDLKPGNILVNKEGIPKLLDFGIAKLLDESAQAILQDGTVAHTRVHDRLLTPEYASPEQIRGQPVTTTSDVYALGIVLYELLTGTRPYTVNALSQLELERSICIQDPLKPSQMIASLARHITQPHSTLGDINLIPTARKSSFKKLQQTLEGDLDAIVMKALRKEPEKRYSSVEHLMDDLNRHLHQEPVDARQGNRWYYTQRFIKRHTLGVIAGTTALLALMAVAIILSIQAHQLKQQRDIAKQERDKATQENERAETVSNFMLDVFTAADPFQSQDKQVTAKELLDKAANKIESTLNDQPEVKARLLEAIGEAYGNQGSTENAIRYLEEAIVATQSIKKPDIGHLARLHEDLGTSYFEKGDLDSANRHLELASSLLQS